MAAAMSASVDALRLLLLEDDAALREDILVPGLAEYGFAVAGVATAAALYESLRAQAPDIVVLDVGLPDADGFSVAQAVRALMPNIGFRRTDRMALCRRHRRCRNRSENRRGHAILFRLLRRSAITRPLFRRR